jgi:hypothetical protein
LRRIGPGLISGGDPAAHFRQQHRAGGDADDAEGQLVDPIGEI